jgi:ferredoxin
MIVGERKPLPEILANIKQVNKLLIVGCDTCVAVCLAGGAKAGHWHHGALGGAAV